jgi:sorbitol-6-phosphate 2-dehydrogenase
LRFIAAFGFAIVFFVVHLMFLLEEDMHSAAFYAPFVRGAIIARIGKPCTVIPVTIQDDSFVITLSGDESEKETGAIINNAIAGVDRFKVTVDAGGEIFPFLIAENVSQAQSGANLEPPPVASSVANSRCSTMKDRICLVTGGAQGFGEEIVRGLCDGGALVFIADLNFERAQALAKEINGECDRCAAFAVEVNVGDEASVAAMFEKVALMTGGIDLCVSNAGVLRAQPILEQDIEAFTFVTGINYTGFAIISKHAGLLMRRQSFAASATRPWMTDIIQINSKSGLEGSNKNGAYAGSKFGGIGLVQSFAKELVEYGIKVNAICPGNFFNGPLWSDPEKGLFVQYLKTGKVPGAKTIEDVKAFYESKVPMGRGCEGPDVLKAIYYLVDQAYETGQALPVTGGQVMLS